MDIHRGVEKVGAIHESPKTVSLRMVFVHAGLRPGTAGRFVNRPYKIALCPLWRGNIGATKKNDQPEPPGGELRGRRSHTKVRLYEP